MKKGPSFRRIIVNAAGKSLTPNRLRHVLNAWPPLVAMGIRITRIADDWSLGRLELRLTRLNANMHGAAFGGTLFSMTDVLFGTLVMQRLGVDRYEAWTRTGSFEFIQPGRKGAYLEVEASDELIERILAETEGGYSTVVPYTSVIRDRHGSIVGIGQQDLYVRPRGIGKPPANPAQLEHVEGENLIAAGRTLARLGLRGAEHRERLTEHERVARRCVRPEARAVAWLEGVLEYGSVSLEDYRAAGLPEVVIEALTSDSPSGAAMSLRAEVVDARESLNRY
ncbi:PaaI family thioesterase [Corynebacterium hansenii]|uniref:PaaI family thioesterase n=1 Tax=Corynebacterium hansenii TaxID=394964 RepID=A0ABV7ZQI9_9CORY|nr:DUF4442 domain-containing protein [Corynebacterium hansenii]WJZ00991.1 hypothetical protein CHAN_12025 [Corynebacterium hansenii]